MAVGKEIRGKIKSVENTRKITKAMEMVAASKMRKAQDRMRTARPYSDRIAAITASLSKANPEYRSPYMRDLAKSGKTGNVGFIVVTTDKGLCGGLNTNVLRAVTQKMRDVQAAGGKVSAVAIGNKGFGFLNRAGANVVSHVTQLGDAPNLDRLIGPVKVMLEQFVEGKLDAVHLCFNRFVNTMKQEPTVTALLPLTADGLQSAGAKAAAEGKGYAWDYIYEPDASVVIDELLKRYIEALVYQGVAENMASEQAARMVAMKAATDNAGNLIAELKLIYNKTRQAAITKELSEIVGGAAAV